MPENRYFLIDKNLGILVHGNIGYSVEKLEQGTAELTRIERAINDELHYIEFFSLGAADGYKVYKRIRELRLKRRQIKDRLTIFEDVFRKLGLEDVEKSTLDNLRAMIQHHDQRIYTLREPDQFVHGKTEKIS